MAELFPFGECYIHHMPWWDLLHFFVNLLFSLNCHDRVTHKTPIMSYSPWKNRNSNNDSYSPWVNTNSYHDRFPPLGEHQPIHDIVIPLRLIHKLAWHTYSPWVNTISYHGRVKQNTQIIAELFPLGEHNLLSWQSYSLWVNTKLLS